MQEIYCFMDGLCYTKIGSMKNEIFYWKKVQTLEYSREAVVWESNGFNF